MTVKPTCCSYVYMITKMLEKSSHSTHGMERTVVVYGNVQTEQFRVLTLNGRSLDYQTPLNLHVVTGEFLSSSSNVDSFMNVRQR